MGKIASQRLGNCLNHISGEQTESRTWPVYIYTFGRFSLISNGEALRFARKSQKKPLELLKALIAFGGREISEGILTDALWPDHEGDKGAQNFKTTLHRLRKLLGQQHVLRLQEHRLSLDTQRCWVDVWAFERLLNQAGAACHNKQTKASIEWLDQAISLYHGPFLAHESDIAWTNPCRERLCAKFLCMAGHVGDELYREKKYYQALYYYQKGIEIEETAEHFYRCLMRCHCKLENKAEGLTVYHVCENKLKQKLDVSPAAKTETLYRALQET